MGNKYCFPSPTLNPNHKYNTLGIKYRIRLLPAELLIKWIIVFVIVCMIFSCARNKKRFYQGITVSPSYSYDMSGRTDRVKGYIIKIDDIKTLKDPCLLLLAKGLDKDEAYVDVNGNKYDIPPIASGLLGKIVIPLNIEYLKEGINEIEYFKKLNSDGYEILDSRIQLVKEVSARVVGQTYRKAARGRPASISDFDFIISYKHEYKRKESDVPEWVNRSIRFYRAGIDFDRLDRMFEMFKEAHINLVAVGIPSNKGSEEYKRVKDFIGRCHKNGIRVTSFMSLGGINLRRVVMNPEIKSWISRDEYGELRWRRRGGTYLANLNNKDYRNEVLRRAVLAIDAGVDELYYDWAIGGTGEVMSFFSDVRDLCKKKGKNLSIYGNCKGNILVDEVCDITKSEGTTEAGVWDGKWVHNVAQSRFYYAAGYGWKPYRSKYEGADPGVPNPGAHDVRNGMKCGWKRPIAEASAFQSHFAIAEAGRKLREGWVLKNNKLAMDIWKDICQYNKFLDKNEEFYTNVSIVSKVGLLAPPLIPSFEVSLKRVPLYNALAEMNLMYDVLLLPRIDMDMLKRYKAIVIPDIPWVDKPQLKVIEDYKKGGGKIYTIGSSENLKRLATVYSPPSVCQEIEKETTRKEFLNNIEKLSGEPLITLKGAKYVIANIVKKKGTDRIILHFVNYSESVENVRVQVNLEGFVDRISKENIRLLSPDQVPKEVKGLSIKGKKVEFTIPKLEIYNVVVIN